MRKGYDRTEQGDASYRAYFFLVVLVNVKLNCEKIARMYYSIEFSSVELVRDAWHGWPSLPRAICVTRSIPTQLISTQLWLCSVELK